MGRAIPSDASTSAVTCSGSLSPAIFQNAPRPAGASPTFFKTPVSPRFRIAPWAACLLPLLSRRSVMPLKCRSCGFPSASSLRSYRAPCVAKWRSTHSGQNS
jgi:hypothetical protein